MTPDKFKVLVAHTFDQCASLLTQKEKEYSEGKDRLDQFHKAATINHTDPLKALAGMMVKHTTSIYDMIDEVTSERAHKPISMKKWEEKIHDHINYLLFAKALILDCGYFSCVKETDPVDVLEAKYEAPMEGKVFPR